MPFVRYFGAVLLFAIPVASDELCHGQIACEDVSTESAQASAMLQVKTEPEKVDMSAECARLLAQWLAQWHLQESQHKYQACVNDDLQEAHLQAVRQDNHTVLIHHATKSGSVVSQPTVTGATASLDAKGFKSVTSLCCPAETEQFFNRLLEKMGLVVCSKPHVQGLMHWFSCVPDLNFKYMVDVINNGNPCKYWTLKGTTCPTLSTKCRGQWCR